MRNGCKCVENLKEKVHVGDIDVDGRTLLRFILKEMDVRMWTEMNCLMISFGGRLLRSRQ
jgi:hypothetical protein